MAIELVNNGNFEGDPNADDLYDAFGKVNRSLRDLDARLMRTSAIPQGPAGEQGLQGIDGNAGTIEIGDVTTVSAGGTASVVNRGTANAAILDFAIPRGLQGIQGVAGDIGPQGLKGETGERGLQGLRGLQGDPGPRGLRGETGTVFVGTVTTVAPSEPAVVTNVGTPQAAVLNFRIPRGESGGAGGSGDVIGPETSTDGGLALFDGVGGKTLKSGPVPSAVAISGQYADIIGRPTQASDLGAASQSDFAGHVANTTNPHMVTKAQVGLANVDNTSDANKPISTATATALAGKAPTVHTHTISQVDGLQGELDDLQQGIDTKADAAQTQTALNGKQPLDSDLTAIAALSTQSFGRGLLTLADAAALRSAASLVPGTDVQAQDADLQAIADLATTSFGRSLLTQADAAALRSTAGLVIGTNVQAYSAKLDAVAGQAWAADQITYQTSTTALATTPLTAFARSLLDDTSAAIARGTLGAFATSGGTFTGPISTTPFALGSLTGGTTAANFANGNIQTATLTSGTNTLNVTNVPADGGDLELHLTYQAGALAFTQTINWLIGAGAKSTTLGDTGVTLTAGVLYTVILWSRGGTLYGVIG